MILANYRELISKEFEVSAGSKAISIACLSRKGIFITMEQTTGDEYALHFAKDTNGRTYDEEHINNGALDDFNDLDSLIDFLENPQQGR